MCPLCNIIMFPAEYFVCTMELGHSFRGLLDGLD